MSTSARRRLMRDFKVTFTPSSIPHLFQNKQANTLQRMQSDPPAGVSASPVSENVMTW